MEKHISQPKSFTKSPKNVNQSQTLNRLNLAQRKRADSLPKPMKNSSLKNDESPEPKRLDSPSSIKKADKSRVLRKLRQFYAKKYPKFEIAKYLSKENDLSNESSCVLTHENLSDEIQLIEKARKLKQMKNAKPSSLRYADISSKINSNFLYTRGRSIDAQEVSLMNPRFSPKKASFHNRKIRNESLLNNSFDDFSGSQNRLMSALSFFKAQSVNYDKTIREQSNENTNAVPSLAHKLRPLKTMVPGNLSNTSPKSLRFLIEDSHQIKAEIISPINEVNKDISSSVLDSPFHQSPNRFNHLQKLEKIKPKRNQQILGSLANVDKLKDFSLQVSPILSGIIQNQEMKSNRNSNSVSFYLDRNQPKYPHQTNLKTLKSDPLSNIKNEFHRIKQNLNKTYAEIKEKRTPAKIEWLVYNTCKDYDKIERRLEEGKPRLYNFEDYIKSAYGKNYSVNEFVLAMKPHKLVTDPMYQYIRRDRDLNDLIEKVKQEKFDSVEKD